MKNCPGCGKAGVKPREIKNYKYLESGLDNFILENGVHEYTCKNCSETYVCIFDERQLLQFMTILLLMSPFSLRANELKFLRKSCDLTQAELARALGLRRETVAERESDGKPALDKGSDLLFRAVILVKFTEFLASKDNSHLAPVHFKILDRVGALLIERAAHMEREARKRIELKRTKKATWEVDSPSFTHEMVGA